MKNSIVIASIATLLVSGVANAQIAFTGDMLLRTEQIKDDTGNPNTFTTDRVRQRLRLRLKGDTKINESVAGTFRITTGVNSAAVTMGRVNDLGTAGSYDAGQSVVLDMAYFTYKATDMINITAGKIANPFYQVNDVVFDTDITPEGLALSYKNKFDNTELFFNTGMSWLREQSQASAVEAADDDVQLVGAQLGVNYKEETYNVMLVASSYLFNSIKDSAAIFSSATATNSFGNTATGVAGNYVYGYKLTSIGLEVGTKVSEMPITFFADSITNGAEDVSNNKTATTFGIKINKLKEKGTWAVTLDSRNVEKDAILGVFTDGDSSGGGTNISSLRARFGYQLADNAQMWFNYFDGKKNIATMATAAGSVDTGDASTKANRVQLDFAMNF